MLLMLFSIVIIDKPCSTADDPKECEHNTFVPAFSTGLLVLSFTLLFLFWLECYISDLCTRVRLTVYFRWLSHLISREKFK